MSRVYLHQSVAETQARMFIKMYAPATVTTSSCLELQRKDKEWLSGFVFFFLIMYCTWV